MKLEKIFIIIVFILLVFFISSTMEIFKEEQIDTKNDSFEVRLIYWQDIELVNEIKIINFDDFKLIKFWTFNVSRNYFSILTITFLPKKATILDLKIENDHFKDFKIDELSMPFYFVKGIDIDLFSLCTKDKTVSVLFFFSKFILFKNKKIIDQATCIDSHNSTTYALMNIHHLKFDFGTTYSKQTCKFIFKNSIIDTIEFTSMTNSLIKTNQFGFIPQGNSAMNCTIKNVYFEVYKIKVDTRLLDQDVFEKVAYILFTGEVTEIENDSFKQLNKLSAISILNLNIRQLFSRGIEWIIHLGRTKISNMSNITEIVKKLDYFFFIITMFNFPSPINSTFENIYEIKLYSYPDEDFCWYEDFPFDRLIFLDPHKICKYSCSCTQYWLIQHSYLINHSQIAIDNLTGIIGYTYQSNKYKKGIERCNFKERLKKCQKGSFSRQVEHISSFQSVLIDSQIVDFIFVILTPIISTLGIIVNIINIVTISGIDLNKTPEEKQQKSLVTFMLVYSIINLVYCVIHSISLISKCVDLDSLFCSDLYFTQLAQWYKVIFVEFTASSLKTFSNLVYFCISVNRYILLEKEGKLAQILHKMGEWSTKWKTFWIIFISICLIGLNSHKIVIYEVKNYSISHKINKFESQYFFLIPMFLSNSELYDSSSSKYLSIREVDDRTQVYEVFTYVNFVLNDIIFYLAFTVIDILLVIGFKKATEKKKNFYVDKLNDAKIQKLLTDMEQRGKRIKRVIIVNICILLVIKVFDLFMSVSKFNIWKNDWFEINQNGKLNAFCHLTKICSVYEELVKLLYMLHYSFSIVCFYFLNKNFKINLKKTRCQKNLVTKPSNVVN